MKNIQNNVYTETLSWDRAHFSSLVFTLCSMHPPTVLLLMKNLLFNWIAEQLGFVKKECCCSLEAWAKNRIEVQITNRLHSWLYLYKYSSVSWFLTEAALYMFTFVIPKAWFSLSYSFRRRFNDRTSKSAALMFLRRFKGHADHSYELK